MVDRPKCLHDHVAIIQNGEYPALLFLKQLCLMHRVELRWGLGEDADSMVYVDRYTAKFNHKTEQWERYGNCSTN